ncbi:cephalosporin hydroxylase family protein [Rhodanobacter sp. OK091]|uniref:cephalosporin hydroxylase family protein n=1 Tax=Rhodanobacter sp. OK091 TaxID=1881037 RepID=UPI00091215BF|nr:cephalosporin hydroxylase family protein [Rhodanobacter sp. OK091]SHM30077.1 Cephalosporin hydroxylase [Rhodanobacter sp. OK091]
MNPVSEFEESVARNVNNLKQDDELRKQSIDWMSKSIPHRYSYNFRWMGRPIIQYPQDMIAMQEILWRVQPDLIVETGIAHGGSLVFYASICELIGKGEVLGIDIDIRTHNREAIETHPMFKRITMLEGSSTSPEMIAQVKAIAENKKVLVVLDSNHTHDHVLAELHAYAPLVALGSYCVVFDTVIEDMPANLYPDRPWDTGNNPKTATRAFLAEHSNFVVDDDIEAKILITVAPSGYLRRVE